MSHWENWIKGSAECS